MCSELTAKPNTAFFHRSRKLDFVLFSKFIMRRHILLLTINLPIFALFFFLIFFLQINS